jgi:hypothetical protein
MHSRWSFRAVEEKAVVLIDKVSCAHFGQFEGFELARADSNSWLFDICQTDEATNHDTLVLPRAWLLKSVGYISRRCLPSEL